MKTIKKLLAVLMATTLSITALCACGNTEKKPLESGKEPAGMLSAIGVTEEKLNNISGDTEWTFFDSLDAMLLALQSQKIKRANYIPESVGQYVTANNDKILFGEPSNKRSAVLNYHMGVLKDNKDLQNTLNNALAEMKSDGTLTKLSEKYIDGYIIKGKTPEAIEIPEIKGAKTIKVAITGSLPPLDFVSEDGKAAGFNVAVLAEISKRANLNIELVNIDCAARSIALTSGKVDALFWVATIEFAADSELKGNENIDVPENVALTDSYYFGKSGQLTLK